MPLGIPPPQENEKVLDGDTSNGDVLYDDFMFIGERVGGLQEMIDSKKCTLEYKDVHYSCLIALSWRTLLAFSPSDGPMSSRPVNGVAWFSRKHCEHANTVSTHKKRTRNAQEG